MDPTFAGKRAFITGGSAGIGLALASELVAGGASVAICGRDPERLRTAVRSLEALAGRQHAVSSIELDVSDEAAVTRAASEILTRLGGLDLLINNAGITLPAAALDTSIAQFRHIMDVNYFGTLYVTKAFLDHFVSQRRGTIAGVSSLAGVMGVYGYAAYAASKHALLGFFDTLRQEMRPHGVSVSVLLPGDTDTPGLAGEEPLKPAATRAVAGNVPVLSAQRVARDFLAGIEDQRFHVVPGAHAKFVHLAQRLAPALVRRVIDADVRRALGS